jgi:hypothetical protein
MPRLILKTKMAGQQVLELHAGANLFGRDPHLDFPIDDATVSSRHCEIVVTGDTLRVRDFDSTNGTFINQAPIKEAELRPGDWLQLGAVEMQFETPPVIAIPIVPLPQPAAPSVLPDGSAACLNHADTPAAWMCKQCGLSFCRACIHVLRRAGGVSLHLCPACSGHCERLGDEETKITTKTSFLQSLTDTIRMTFRRK